jgi:hypothetical protein
MYVYTPMHICTCVYVPFRFSPLRFLTMYIFEQISSEIELELMDFQSFKVIVHQVFQNAVKLKACVSKIRDETSAT